MQLRSGFLFTPFLLASTIATAESEKPIRVTAELSDRGAIVRANGELFAEYLALSGHQPAVWPIIGPTGKPVTRSYPIGPLLDTERDDHRHHHSMWLAHEDVNGHDFWRESRKGVVREAANVIKHMGFVEIASSGNQATIVTRNRWLAGGANRICEDERRLVFGAEEDARWIDFTIKIMASDGAVTFADVKDCLFSTRVAGTMKADSGGTLVNSRGQRNADAWGMPADWIDNYGPLEGEVVGLAMFSHPSNFRHPTRWHARTYGLLCANPFGEHQFPKANIKQQGYTIAADDSLTLRYRVYLHRGDTKHGKVEEAYAEFSGQKQVGCALPRILKGDCELEVDRWARSEAGPPDEVWPVRDCPGEAKGNVLRVSEKRGYQPPHRSPHSVALNEDVVDKHVLNPRVQNKNSHAENHRDLCFFLRGGHQDRVHFYDVQLSAKLDPHSSQIFVVKGEARTMITTNEPPGSAGPTIGTISR